MASFATRAELEKRLQTTFADATSQANADFALTMASAQVQAYTGQRIEAVANDTVTLDPPCGYWLFLPEQPVTAVASVSVDGVLVPITDYAWYPDGRLLRTSGWWGTKARSVVVVYSHGYATIPDAVKDATLNLAVRLWINAEGVESEGIGTYNITYQSAESDGLTTEESLLLAAYKTLVVA